MVYVSHILVISVCMCIPTYDKKICINSYGYGY